MRVKINKYTLTYLLTFEQEINAIGFTWDINITGILNNLHVFFCIYNLRVNNVVTVNSVAFSVDLETKQTLARSAK